MLAPLPAIYLALTKSQSGAENSQYTSPYALTPNALRLRRVGIALMVFGWLGLVLVYSFISVPARWDATVSNSLGWTGACGLLLFRFARVLARPRTTPSALSGR